MDFKQAVITNEKFQNPTFRTNEKGFDMLGFYIRGKHTYSWFEKVGDTWFFHHAYSQNTGETKRSCRCMPKSIQRIYLAHIGLSSDYID